MNFLLTFLTLISFKEKNEIGIFNSFYDTLEEHVEKLLILVFINLHSFFNFIMILNLNMIIYVLIRGPNNQHNQIYEINIEFQIKLLKKFN